MKAKGFSFTFIRENGHNDVYVISSYTLRADGGLSAAP